MLILMILASRVWAEMLIPIIFAVGALAKLLVTMIPVARVYDGY